jgi:cytochrome c2
MKLALAAIAALTLSIGIAQAQEGDAAAGEAVFKKCAACHAVGEGAKNRVGPVLNGVFGRVAGTADGYKYSQAMIDAGAGGLTWDHDTLKQYLADPKSFVPGNKMTFAGVKNPAEEENLLAYLLTFSPEYSPAQ